MTLVTKSDIRYIHYII